MEFGVLSLSYVQTDPATGTLHDPARRARKIVSFAITADQAGLDVFALGEYHSPDFSVAKPAIPLAAIAQATARVRLAGAVSVLSTLDPARLPPPALTPHPTRRRAPRPRPGCGGRPEVRTEPQAAERGGLRGWGGRRAVRPGGRGCRGATPR